MWIDQKGEAIPTNAQYVAPNGTTYPWNFPRDEIPGAIEVPDPEPLPPNPPVPQNPEQIQAQVTAATQDRLDAFARTRGYDSILSAATYDGDPSPRLAAEGAYAKSARSATWETLYAYMAEVLAGNAPMPAGFEDVEPLLPVLEWPQ